MPANPDVRQRPISRLGSRRRLLDIVELRFRRASDTSINPRTPSARLSGGNEISLRGGSEKPTRSEFTLPSRTYSPVWTRRVRPSGRATCTAFFGREEVATAREILRKLAGEGLWIRHCDFLPALGPARSASKRRGRSSGSPAQRSRLQSWIQFWRRRLHPYAHQILALGAAGIRTGSGRRDSGKAKEQDPFNVTMATKRTRFNSLSIWHGDWLRHYARNASPLTSRYSTPTMTAAHDWTNHIALPNCREARRGWNGCCVQSRGHPA